MGLRDPPGRGCQPGQHVVSRPPGSRSSSLVPNETTRGPSLPPRRLFQPTVSTFTFIDVSHLRSLFDAVLWYNMVAATMVIVAVVSDDRSPPCGFKGRKRRLEGCSLLCRPCWSGSQPTCCSCEVVLRTRFMVIVIIKI